MNLEKLLECSAPKLHHRHYPTYWFMVNGTDACKVFRKMLDTLIKFHSIVAITTHISDIHSLRGVIITLFTTSLEILILFVAIYWKRGYKVEGTMLSREGRQNKVRDLDVKYSLYNLRGLCRLCPERKMWTKKWSLCVGPRFLTTPVQSAHLFCYLHSK